MPVTATLSRKFYERFGDELTNELVEWFNQVDTAYRSEFRDLFEVHFVRFDATLEQRVGELRAELTGKLDSKLSGVESKLSAVETRLIASYEEQDRARYGGLVRHRRPHSAENGTHGPATRSL